MADKKGCILSEVLRSQVKERFDRLKQALDIREKILLRQVDVLAGHQACKHMMIENIEFLAENEFDMLKRITSFGKFSIKHFQIKNDAACLGVEEYIPSIDDHHEERKSIEHNKGSVPVHHHCITVGEPPKIPNCTSGIPENHETNELYLGYSNNKYRHCSPPSPIRHPHKEKNIRITINETRGDTGCKQPVTHHHEKQCIDLTTTTSENNRHKFKICELISNSAKSKLNKQITIATTTQTSTQTDPHLHPPAPGSAHHVHHQKATAGGHNIHSHPDKSKVLKNISNLSLSNSSGTINLRNISNLTINSSCNRMKTDKDHIHHSSENGNCPDNTECGFYNRLITENKSLQYQLLKNAFGKQVCTPPMSSLEHVHNDTAMPNIINNNNNESSPLPHCSSSEHPVQVQQWLKQIVYETETEPLVNAEFMEFINIKR